MRPMGRKLMIALYLTSPPSQAYLLLCSQSQLYLREGSTKLPSALAPRSANTNGTHRREDYYRRCRLEDMSAGYCPMQP